MIILYVMNGCGFCVKAKEELKNEINSGLVIIKDSSEIKGVLGFPFFLNQKNGKTHQGYAPKNQLFKKLGIYNEEFIQSTNNLDNINKCFNCHVKKGSYLKLYQTYA